MGTENKSDISVYLENKEIAANKYVMKCFTITMLVYATALFLNLIGVFVIEQSLMWQGFIPSLIIYCVVVIVTKMVSMDNPGMKYFILFSIIMLFTITGVFITYHVVLVSLLPFLYAALYSSKPVMRYVYFLTVVSTIIVVYGGYYFGLCDANMVLLTDTVRSNYIIDGQFVLNMVNEDPSATLFLFFVAPRCLIYIAVVAVCSSLYKILNGSLEKARLTEELAEAKAEAERANAAKSDFLAKMSHEIRTPINAVIGMNEMIIRESGEAHIKDYAHDVKDSSVMLLNIVNEILDSSKIESGMMEIVPVNYEVSSLLNDLYNMTDIKAKEKGLELAFEIEPTIPGELYGDDKRIRQVLLNLLSNAVKYTNEGTVTLKVSADVAEGVAQVHYAVCDTGMGIKEEDIHKLYTAFQRFDLERNRNVEGTGLGMNIAQQLLKLMGSELKIESEYGKGSQFAFSVSQKVVNEQPIGDFNRRLSKAKERTDYRQSYIAPKAKILVVDDYRMNLKVFRNLLKQTQIQVSTADSGPECLELLKEQTFDIIFLDHMMPGMNGIEVLHEIKKQGLNSGKPIVMLTANAMVGSGEKYMKEGFDGFLSKPILPEKLDKMILGFLPEEMISKLTEVSEELGEGETEEEIVVENEITPKLPVLIELMKKLPELNFEKGFKTCSGDEEFYLELLQDFISLPIKEELENFVSSKDYTGYNIRIHGFKNSAYSIGAEKLGDLAYQMEKGTDGEPTERLPGMQEMLFAQYDKICAVYNGITSGEKGEK